MRKKTIQKVFNIYTENKNYNNYKSLYLLLRKRLRLYIKKILNNYDIVDKDDIMKDILNETLFRILNKFNKYDDNWKFSTWVYKIAKNVTIDTVNDINKLNKLRLLNEKNLNEIERTIIFDTEIIDDIDDKMMLKNNKMHMLCTAIVEDINKLPDVTKNIMIDKVLNNMKYKDMSLKYNEPSGKIKNRVYRNKKVLKKKYNSAYISINQK